jgi:hypothetical protein
LLVVCTARPDLLTKRPGWGGGKPNSVTISLAALTEKETARLVHFLLERAVLPAGLQATLIERAGGNPLYAEEFARMVEERGSLADSDLPLPESLQGIIAARLDALSAEEKKLILACRTRSSYLARSPATATRGRLRRSTNEPARGRLSSRKSYDRESRTASTLARALHERALREIGHTPGPACAQV